ncbi:MAG: ABC transporter permease [Nitrospinota bacterium]|nr:MAG: ABC transporter permease [Nitrospinota bacterium]
MRKLRRRILRFFRRHPTCGLGVLLGPAAFWLLVFTLIPMLIVVYYSFLTRGPWGTIRYEFTLENYRQILDPLFLKIFFRSFRLALLTSLFCLIGGYVVAYWIAFYGGRHKSLLLFLVILPFWTSYLVRIYSWMTLLADHGLVNNFLTRLHLIREPLPLLHNEFAVLVGLVYTYLPFMILPLYASLERLDRSVLEAAADLGATPAERFFKVTLPLTRGGMLSGSVLVFVPAIGEFLVPELLGGAKAMMIGKFITLKFTGLRHWPLGSAFSLLLLALILLLLFLYMRVGGGKEAFQEQAR